MKNLFAQQIKKVDPKALPFILAGAVVLLVAVDIVFLMGPQVRAVAAAGKKAVEMHISKSAFASERKNLPELVAQRDALLQQIAGIEGQAYRREELPRLLHRISTLAGRYAVLLDRVTPQQEAQRLLVTAGKTKYYAVPVFIQARSGYRKFSKFLKSLEKERIFWKVNGFSFIADTQYAQKNQIGFLVEVVLFNE